jgi:hypothetical protein
MARRRPLWLAGTALAVVLLAGASASRAAPAALRFRVYADTGIKLTDVLWTGRRFLYVENTENTMWAAGPSGTPLTRFAALPKEVEETRCRLSPGAHGFPRGELYCHAPDNTIYRISADGSSVAVFARLPDSSTSDGALAFDTVGRFGYALLAGTGRSGAPDSPGGRVFAIGADGAVREIGTYPGPGGADELAVAPRRFGTAGGDAVLTVDAGGTGAIVVVDPRGASRTIASLPDGPNPIAVVPPPPRAPKNTVPPGLYVTDTNSHAVFFAAASQFGPYVGDLVVATELKALFWIVRPRGGGFEARRIAATLPGGSFNLEGATYVAG